MAKSRYLFKLLPAIAICIYSYPGGVDVSKISKQGQHMVVPVFTDKRQAVKTVYDGELGVHETGPNAGIRVEEYLRYVNLKKGEPWCAAFVCWVFGQAGIANPKSGWSPSLFRDGKIIWNRNKSGATPQAGDIFGIWFSEKNRIAHTGFIDQWNKNWVITVEGNTNDKGSREGDGVYRKRRPTRSIYAAASYIVP